MSDRNYGPTLGSLGFLVGAVIGGITAIMLITDETGNTLPEVKNRIALGKARARAEMQKVRGILNESWESLNQHYLKAKHSLILKLEQLKKTAVSIDKTRYMEAVNDVVTEMKKSGTATAEQLTNIKTFLAEDYHRLTTAPDAKKVPSRKKA